MSTDSPKHSIGKSIDDVILALNDLDTPTRIIVIRTVCSHLSIPLHSIDPNYTSSNIATSRATIAPPSTSTNESMIDIRTFKEQKEPSSAREMACVIAFYLQSLAPNDERKQEINSEDLERYFKQADFPLPKRIVQLLVDAKAAGYFDATSSGTYKLNAVGYNLVAHTLPRSGSKIKKASPKRKKKASKK